MNYILRSLYFIFLVLACVLPVRYNLCGTGLIMAISSLITAASITHPTERQEGAYLVASLSGFFWVGVVFFAVRDLMLALAALLFFGAGVMVLLMMGGSYLCNGPDDLIAPDKRHSLTKALGRDLWADFQKGRAERKQKKWTVRRTLQLMLWVCVFASAAVMLSGYSIVLAGLLSGAAIALTFSYEGSSVGRVRSTYGAFASLCFIGVLGPWSLGPIPLIFFVMTAILAVLTTSNS